MRSDQQPCGRLKYCVVTTETTQSGESFLSRPCMHCQEAPCVHVCPVRATFKPPYGIVAMDYTRCIGCRYCQVACPYDGCALNWRDPIELSPQSPTFGLQEVDNRPRGVVELTFCTHRIDPGLERGLVRSTRKRIRLRGGPTTARIFGDLTILKAQSRSYYPKRRPSCACARNLAPSHTCVLHFSPNL